MQTGILLEERRRERKVTTTTMSSSSSMRRGFKLQSLSAALDLEELRESIEDWFQEQGGEPRHLRNVGLGVGIAVIGVVALLLGLFSVLIPATYGVGGYVLYRNKGWRFYQPGVGGARFVALNGVAWFLFALALIVQFGNFRLRDPLLTFNSVMLSAVSYCLMVGALFSYHSPEQKEGAGVEVTTPSDEELNATASPNFNAELQNSVLMQGENANVSFFWWIFIGMQVSLAVMSFVVSFVGGVSNGNEIVRMLSMTFSLWTNAAALSTTHALGGKWRHIQSNYAAFQPGRGGFSYVALQAAGWSIYGISIIAGWISLGSLAQSFNGRKPTLPNLMAVSGILGLVAEGCVIVSLFLFQDEIVEGFEESKEGFRKMVESEESSFGYQMLMRLVKLQIALLNALLGPFDPEAVTRDPILDDPNAHLACDERWAHLLAEDCPATGDTYLVVGNGFVGKRLVDALLDRGETDIRVFDIVYKNHWEGDGRVVFIQGDVTKKEEIELACEGVDTVYSTFAIIRFMDRLEHQAYLSYHVNVTGTEVLLEACREQNVKRLVVTSSSHATTDEFSQPRYNRDETAKLITRKEAHNHYGWTKAIADQLSLAADGSKLANGSEMRTVVVRPCSGVFGADDALSFEKVMDMRVIPGVGAKAVMDWVPVQSVVQGHLLAEKGLQDDNPDVRGEAFCISNDDPTSMQDFWWLVIKYIRQLPNKKMRKRLELDFVYVPEGLLWVLAYFSEFNQKMFKGKVSLTREVDMLTPAMLSTATMSYSYSSKKARKVLCYKPIFSLDEAVQRGIYEYYDRHYGRKKKVKDA